MQADGEQGEAEDVGQQDGDVAVGGDGHGEQQRQPDQGERPGRHGERRRGIGGEALRGLRLAQQAEGADDQDDRHDQELDHQGELGEVDLRAEPVDGADADAEGFRDADQDGGEEGAADAAQAADHGDDEGVGDDGKVELEIGGLARDLQRAAQTGQHRADEEHRGEELGLVDAERAHHLAVLGRGTHQRAPARARQQQPHGEQHDRTDGDQQQVVGRDAAAQDLDRHGEAGRARADQVLGAPGEERDVLDHQHDGEGGEQLEQLGRAVDAAQHQHLDQHADQADGQAASTTEVQKPSGVRPSAWIRL